MTMWIGSENKACEDADFYEERYLDELNKMFRKRAQLYDIVNDLRRKRKIYLQLVKSATAYEKATLLDDILRLRAKRDAVLHEVELHEENASRWLGAVERARKLLV